MAASSLGSNQRKRKQPAAPSEPCEDTQNAQPSKEASAAAASCCQRSSKQQGSNESADGRECSTGATTISQALSNKPQAAALASTRDDQAAVIFGYAAAPCNLTNLMQLPQLNEQVRSVGCAITRL